VTRHDLEQVILLNKIAELVAHATLSVIYAVLETLTLEVFQS